MGFALGDAAFLTGLERNADVIVMNAYAPLLVNVNPGGRQWQVNLIGYDGLTSFGSPAYYAQKMFANNRARRPAATFDPLPRLTAAEIPQAPIGRQCARARRAGERAVAGPGPVSTGSTRRATRENSWAISSSSVNVQAAPQPLTIDLQGVRTVSRTARGEVLAAEVGS